MRNIQHLVFLIVSFIFLSYNGISQVKEFDKLEMLFDQGHYKVVYRKSNKLIDNPEFDYSKLPLFYKSISMLELSRNSRWLKRNQKSIKQAIDNLEELNLKGSFFDAHQDELVKVYRNLNKHQNSNLDIRNEELNHQYSFATNYLKQYLPENYDAEISTVKSENSTTKKSTDRDQLVEYAKTFIGVPYVYSGTTPKGFDCSGFTSYVLENSGLNIPRRAADQERESNSLKVKSIQKGDLIFFDNGGDVSHVGIIVSNKNGKIEMIHASSSKGIIITDVSSSKYWSKRIHSYGTFFD
jgi:peptidoglycan DL-endopeptidase CwlO